MQKVNGKLYVTAKEENLICVTRGGWIRISRGEDKADVFNFVATGYFYCPFCEYAGRSNSMGNGMANACCQKFCPYYVYFGKFCYRSGEPFQKWHCTHSDNPVSGKKYALEFVAELKEIQDNLIVGEPPIPLDTERVFNSLADFNREADMGCYGGTICIERKVVTRENIVVIRIPFLSVPTSIESAIKNLRNCTKEHRV